MIGTLLLVLTLAGGLGAAEVPLGHPDFRPTAERPVGWRGDGTGVWPGATPPAKWSETENVIWKIEMPSHTSSSPVVVGRRVFTLREPNFLVCVDADTGKVLWERENDPLEIRGVDAATVAKVKRLTELAKMSRYLVLGQRPDDRGSDEAIQAQREKFLAADRSLLALLHEAATLDPQLSEAAAGLEKLLNQPDRPPKELAKSPKSFYAAIGTHVARTHRFHAENTWPGYIDHTFPTPVTDGRFIYVAMGQDQVACYDLDGQRIWAQSLGLGPELNGKGQQTGDRSTYVQSPLLVDGMLIVQSGFLIRAYDAATGKVRWELPYPPQGASYSCGTAQVVKIGNENVIVTVHSWVIRARDGKVLADLKLGNQGSESGGASMVGEGDAVYFFRGDKTMHKVRLRWKSDGVIAAETVWTSEWVPSGMTPIVHDGLLYVCSNGKVNIHDTATGALRHTLATEKGTGKPSPTIAGNLLIVPNDQGVYTVLTTGPAGKRVGTGKLEYSKPRVPWFEKQWPDIYRDMAQKGRGFNNTVPSQFTYSHPAYAGDRLYIRSVSHLYCIGSKP